MLFLALFRGYGARLNKLERCKLLDKKASGNKCTNKPKSDLSQLFNPDSCTSSTDEKFLECK